MNFPSIRLEGSIITADLLDAIAREDKSSQKPADFGLDPSTKVKDEVASTWASAKALWTGYQAKIVGLREGQTGVSETRNLFILPLLALLGYQPDKSDAEILNGKSYAISHRDFSRDGFPLHIMGWNDSLEQKRVSGGPRISPHALLQEYINLTEHLYGLITNGRQLRLLRDSSRLIKLSFLDFDLVRIFEEDLYADFAILFRLLHASRMPANRANASGSVIEKYHQESVDSGSRIRDGLAAAVAYAMQTVANGLLAHPANAALVEQLRAHPSQASDFHQNLLRWVYRTLFVLVIEERVLNHAPDATLRQRQLYRDYYSLHRLRRLADRPQLADRRAHDLWRAMHQTLRLYEDGGKGLPLGVPPLGSFLFREEGLRALFRYQLDNRSLLQALNRLSTFNHPDTQVRMRVNYGALDVEEFGSVYESLLELRPRIIPDGDKLTFSYAQLAGNERKTTGSYYTPDSLVQCLLDSALNPVVDERLKGKTGEEAEEALLSIKVCDPAVGSGHFLIGAAHRLAQRLADIRAGEEALSPDVQRHALRDVVSRCLYGVDVNPLSVELCKVSLWMLALEPGKPLSFLDHHIQCGNSLLGVTPRLVDEGLPDDAFKPITGDDRAVCTEAKKRNKDERKQLALFHGGTEIAPWQRLGNLPAAMLAVDTMSDDTAAELHRKEERYAELVRSSGYLHSRFLADAWCAAFVWKKTRDMPYPITNDVLRKIERNPHDCALWMRDEIQRLRDKHLFFHWHIAFPDVFQLPGRGEAAENKQTGWKGGFDVVLGNPPWERVKIQEKEWFAAKGLDIAIARNASKRKLLIAELQTTNPGVFEEFAADLRAAEADSHYFRNSGIYPLCGGGDINTFALFAELSLWVIGHRGRAGIIVPPGIATDATYEDFIQYVMKHRCIVSFFDFTNRGYLFPSTESTFAFALLTLSSEAQAKCMMAAQLWSVADLQDSTRAFVVSAESLERLNPNTLNFPIIRSTKDFALVEAIYLRLPILMRERPPASNPWDCWFGTAFHMSNDSGTFKTEHDLEAGHEQLVGNLITTATGQFVPLYESKLAHQFNHRHATFVFGDSNPLKYGTRARTESVTPSALASPTQLTIPRYWVSEADAADHLPNDWPNAWLLGYRRTINAVADARSVVACILPKHGVGDSLFLLLPSEGARKASALVAIMNSFVFDYVARQKASGGNLSFYVVKQLPVIEPQKIEETCSWFRSERVMDWIGRRVLELTYTAWDLEPFARDCGWFGPPFVWDEARRFQLRCELDAAFFHLYGVSRDDTDYILDTFPVVRRKDEAAHGSYRTRDTILALYDELPRCAAEARSFTNAALAVPPADPRAAHEPRLPATPRAAYAGKTYFETVLPLLLRMAPDGLETAQLFHAMTLLTDGKLRAAESARLPGESGGAWAAAFRETYRWEDAAAALIGEIAKRRIRGVARLRLAPDAAVVESDPWLAVDAFMALRLALSAEPAVTVRSEAAHAETKSQIITLLKAA